MIQKRTYTFERPKAPNLWWVGKQDRPSFTVDTVPLAIFERFSPVEILRRVRPKSSNNIDAYHHGSTWANRLILGDSLLVMNSLLELEHMSGSIQMVYLDPPYGINYNSKFHVLAPRAENTDENDSNTSKSENVHAYHDSWAQGIPSYLSHLRDRLLLVKELLHESGSIFVQIGAENAHLVRMLLDEIFGIDNYVDTITVQKTSGFSSRTLSSISDYLLWYSKNKTQMKYRPLFTPKHLEDLNLNLYRFVEEIDGTRRTLTKAERANPRLIPADARIYRIGDLTSQGATKGSSSLPCEFEGKTYLLGKNAHWKTTQEGLRNLVKNRRIQSTRSNIYYVRFLEDFPVKQLSNIWTDTGQGGFNDPKVYAVQTNTKVVQRCILMTTDPGDLVFDPTCGSGTTAMVAEQWGRRWITCDTSPVATFLARQRLITSVFPSYLLQSPQEGVKGDFQYRSVPHVKLKNLAFDEALRHELLYDDPLIDPTKMRVPGLVNFESLTGEPDLPDDLIANMLLNLQNSGISLPGLEIIPLNNLEICKQGVITVTGNLSREHAHKKIALCFSSPYSPLTLGGISDAKAEAGDTFDIISFMGFHFLPEVQTRIFSERDHHPRLTLASVNFEILLKDLLPTVKGTQLFTMMGHPVMEIKSTTEKNKAFINLQGIQVFNPKTSQYYTIPPKHIAAWFLDESYDGHAFYIHQCAFLGRKNPWQKAQRGLRGILEDEDFQILSGTQSRPFTCYQGQKIALKVFDFQGNDVSIIITIGE